MLRPVILPNRQKDPSQKLSLQAFRIMKTFCSSIYTPAENTCLIEEGAVPYTNDAFPSDASLIVVLGGDGSLLHAASLALRYDIPLLGINIGHLGYLSSLEFSEIDKLGNLTSGAFFEQTRMTLAVSVRHADGVEEVVGVALNELVVSGNGHLARLRLCDGEGYLDYRADGLIIATPTGSTAYSLSAGGPVMDESMNAFCVTPICPRSFFSRSVLFSEDRILSITSLDEREAARSLSIDGVIRYPLSPLDEILVRRSEKSVRFLMPGPRKLLNVLTQKMNAHHF